MHMNSRFNWSLSQSGYLCHIGINSPKAFLRRFFHRDWTATSQDFHKTCGTYNTHTTHTKHTQQWWTAPRLWSQQQPLLLLSNITMAAHTGSSPYNPSFHIKAFDMITASLLVRGNSFCSKETLDMTWLGLHNTLPQKDWVNGTSNSYKNEQISASPG